MSSFDIVSVMNTTRKQVQKYPGSKLQEKETISPTRILVAPIPDQGVWSVTVNRNNSDYGAKAFLASLGCAFAGLIAASILAEYDKTALAIFVSSIVVFLACVIFVKTSPKEIVEYNSYAHIAMSEMPNENYVQQAFSSLLSDKNSETQRVLLSMMSKYSEENDRAFVTNDRSEANIIQKDISYLVKPLYDFIKKNDSIYS